MEISDSSTIHDNSLMVLCGPVVEVVGNFFKEGSFSFFLSNVFGSNSSNREPAKEATLGAVSFGTSQNFANRFGGCRSDSSLERRPWLVGWVAAVSPLCVSWLAVVVGAGLG